MKQKMLVRSLIAAGVIAVGVGGLAKYDVSVFTHADAAPVVATASAQSAAALPNFTGIVARYGPAVVNISVTNNVNKVNAAPAMPNLSPNNPFYQFFRQFRVPLPQGEIPTHAEGSGFIISPNGIILTNAHVVDDASSVTVKLTDRREFKAKVIGIDKPSDVAVLKINASNLPTVTLDRAHNVKVGQWVIAIGSPFGFDNSVTAGIVSAKYRTLPDDTYVPFIQTDVAVNPGNSGGPLFNTKGQVIGINSQIYSRSGGYQGLSFAIPIDVALNIEQQLLQHGSVTRGHLGVAIQDVNQGLADSFGMKQPTGALIASVDKSGAAAKAGLKAGDVILSYNGTKIESSSRLPLLVADTTPGTTVKLEVLRNGKTRQFEVTVGAARGTKLASANATAHDQGRLGVVVRRLNPDEQKQAGVGGVVVENVSGPAANAGIQPGDIILSLNGTPVTSSAQLKQLAANAGKHVALLVQRDDARIFVPLDLG
jgi:serine protease Do